MSEVKSSGMMTYLNCMATPGKIQRKVEEKGPEILAAVGAIGTAIIVFWLCGPYMNSFNDHIGGPSNGPFGGVPATFKVNPLWSKNPEVI